ncbi:hypothetical protein U1Q18_019361 [Sarracenia purpurea var. burkii]
MDERESEDGGGRTIGYGGGFGGGRSTEAASVKCKRIVVRSSSLANGSSSVSEIDHEQEEVAMCLMMLSRDSGNWVGVNSIVESSDNNSVVLETKSSSIDMRIGRKKGSSCVFNGGGALEIKKPGKGKSKSSVQVPRIVTLKREGFH